LAAFIGLEKFIGSNWNQALQRKFFIAIGIAGGLCALMWITAGMFGFSGNRDSGFAQQAGEWFVQAIKRDREALLRGDAFRSLFFILAAGAALYFYMLKRLSIELVYGILIILIGLDLGLVDNRYLNQDNFEKNPSKSYFVEQPADRLIKQDEDLLYRVYNLQTPLPGSEARTSYFHHSLGGYHGTKMRRFEELVDFHIVEESRELINRLREGSRSFEGLNLINIFNVKYVTAGPNENQVLQNPEALGNAWTVSQIQKVNSADEEIMALGEIDPEKTAVVDVSQFPIEKNSFNGHGSVELNSYAPNRLVYEATLPGESFVVFSEAYYPKGWTATIDGNPTEILRTNYHFRSLIVPEGKHTIEFVFEPRSFYMGNKLMTISSILLFLFILIVAFLEFRKYRVNKELEYSEEEEN